MHRCGRRARGRRRGLCRGPDHERADQGRHDHGKDIKKGTIATTNLSAAARKSLTGATGATGATGPAGPAGPAGIRRRARLGPAGAARRRTSSGSPGAGTKGDKGDPGAPGAKGDGRPRATRAIPVRPATPRSARSRSPTPSSTTPTAKKTGSRSPSPRAPTARRPSRAATTTPCSRSARSTPATATTRTGRPGSSAASTGPTPRAEFTEGTLTALAYCAPSATASKAPFAARHAAALRQAERLGAERREPPLSRSIDVLCRGRATSVGRLDAEDMPDSASRTPQLSSSSSRAALDSLPQPPALDSRTVSRRGLERIVRPGSKPRTSSEAPVFSDGRRGAPLLWPSGVAAAQSPPLVLW